MKRSKGTYLQGVIEAEAEIDKWLQKEDWIVKSFTTDILPKMKPKPHDKCDIGYLTGFYDYLNYFLDNVDLVLDTKTKK